MESENISRKVLPIRWHAVDLGRALLVPSFGQTHVRQHFLSVRTIFGTPFVPIEIGVDVLGLVDESVTTRLCFRPSVQFVPASTHAGLMEASVLFLRLCGIHGRVVCIAENILQDVIHAMNEVCIPVELRAIVICDCYPAADFSLHKKGM